MPGSVVAAAQDPHDCWRCARRRCCWPRRRRRCLTRPDKTVAATPDLIGRDFTVEAPGRRLVGDITYLHTREVVGHAMGNYLRAELVCEAITLAADRGLGTQSWTTRDHARHTVFAYLAYYTHHRLPA